MGKTFDSLFVGSDGCTFDSDVVFLDCVCGVDCDLIVCGITVFHAQIVVFDVDVQEREDKLFLDHLPDDSCLFVSIEFDDRILDFNLLLSCCRSAIGVLGGATNLT